MTRTEEFEEVRPLLLAIAHRILGSASRAEDAVRVTGRRWADTSVHPESVESHLAAEVTRVSTETLRSDRLDQDPHAGPWAAAPLLTGPDPDPERPAELTDSLLTAALLVLERLSPLERAVFVLREAFGCSVEETAAAVGCSPEACGQLVAAIATTSDGDRDPLPWPTYIAGTQNVARLLAAIVPPLRRIGVTVENRVVNGRPGSVFRDRTGRVLNALTLGVHEDRIEEVHLVVNPDLIAHADPVAEAYAILREANQGR
ncbi:sigma factor-like helix-turn-helix DNA-binding protein [Streptomyces justiciae]|uniref:Sigma factor-like helix-turn-helix DNA-binding protein n=1 Tax=Streptomyces justiciae TaxID=2780140 RepID=A0ABU3M7Q0_9ACTN|nr:sigma factor-like helix-turn-helix DNA-binding protein [Streptomyces justiciae]MDT7847524.1 sigma factor-like helix-turn-helix DNA-binding protein [Streptomyces justiciae]